MTGPFEAAELRGGEVGDGVLVHGDVASTIATLLAERGIGGLVELAAQVGSDNVTAVWWEL